MPEGRGSDGAGRGWTWGRPDDVWDGQVVVVITVVVFRVLFFFWRRMELGKIWDIREAGRVEERTWVGGGGGGGGGKV